MSEFLKGNFEVKNKVTEMSKGKKKEKTLEEKFEKAALNSIGGSMVYVKRSKLTWDGDDDSK